FFNENVDTRIRKEPHKKHETHSYKEDKEEYHPNKLETDKRTDKQKKTAFDAGMKKGAAVVNNENLSNQAINLS
ncbi:MAG: Unknown protein, partial [uncultured Sulfurovum sp.]